MANKTNSKLARDSCKNFSFGNKTPSTVVMPNIPKTSGCMVAMCGKDCVALAMYQNPVDSQNILMDASTETDNVFKIAPLLYLGMNGLQLNVLTVRDRVLNRKNKMEDIVKRYIRPHELSFMVGKMFFNHDYKPYKVEAVVAGLEPGTLKPHVSFISSGGSLSTSTNYVAAGACDKQLMVLSCCAWKPDLGAKELHDVICNVILTACNSHSVKPHALVYIIEKDRVTQGVIEAID